ncbi:MAG: hypothetical protein V2A76_13400 [Planctomycetota bacterium]
MFQKLVAFVVLILAFSLFSEMRETPRKLAVASWRLVTGGYGEKWSVAHEPHGGEEVLDPGVRIMLEFVRVYDIETVLIRLAPQGLPLMQAIEALYPVRLSRSAPFILTSVESDLPASFRTVAAKGGIQLARRD